MLKCKNCGFIMGDEDKFCNVCGCAQDINKEDNAKASIELNHGEIKLKKKRRKKFIIILTIIFAVVIIGVTSLVFSRGNKAYKATSTAGKLYSGGGVVFLEIGDEIITEESFKQTVKILRDKIEKAGINKYEISRYKTNQIKIDFKDSSQEKKLLNAVYVKEIKVTGPDNQLILTNKDIYTAKYYKGLNGKPALGIILNKEAEEKFQNATEKYMNKVIFIFVDNKLVTTFTLGSVVYDGKLSISGGMSTEQVKEYAKDINDYANIPLKFKLVTNSN